MPPFVCGIPWVNASSRFRENPKDTPNGSLAFDSLPLNPSLSLFRVVGIVLSRFGIWPIANFVMTLWNTPGIWIPSASPPMDLWLLLVVKIIPPCCGTWTKASDCTVWTPVKLSTAWSLVPTDTGCVPLPMIPLRFGILNPKLLLIPCDRKKLNMARFHLVHASHGRPMDPPCLLDLPITSSVSTLLLVSNLVIIAVINLLKKENETGCIEIHYVHTNLSYEHTLLI